MGLTGGYRFRKGLRGKTVLQVEEEFTPFWSASGVVKRRWRDATMIDLADPTLRSLLDLGAGKLRFPSRSNALGGLPNASRTDGGIQQQAAAKATLGAAKTMAPSPHPSTTPGGPDGP
jgi:hypothetical protein